MTAESDVDIDCGECKVDNKCWFDVNSIDVMLSAAKTPVPPLALEMTVGGDEGVSREDGGKEEYDVIVNGGELERGLISEMVSRQCVASNQLATQNGECEELEGKERESEIRVHTRDLVKENEMVIELNDVAEDEGGVSMKETDTVDALESGVHDEVVPCAVVNSCQDPIDGGVSQTKTDLSNDTVNGISTGVSEDVADLRIRNDCYNHIDNKESGVKTRTVNDIEVLLNNVMVNFEIQNSSHDHTNDHTDDKEAKKTDAINEKESGDDDKFGESKVENCCCDDFSSAESRIQAGLLDATDSGFDHKALESVIKHNFCNDPYGSETGFKIGVSASLDVNSQDTELHTETKTGGGETVIENGVFNHSGSETKANDLELIMVDSLANDLVNESDAGRSQNGEMSTIRPGVVEVEHKEFHVDSWSNGNPSAVDDRASKFSLTDNNVSSFHSVISEGRHVVGKDNVLEEKNEILVREIKPDTVNNESMECRQGKGLHPSDINYKEADFGDEAQPQSMEQDSAHVPNGPCGKNEINFGTLKCYIPSSYTTESSSFNQKNGIHNTVHLVLDSSSRVVDSSSGRQTLPSQLVASSNSEENANEIPDCNSIQPSDEAEENNTDDLDFQIPERAKWPFCYLVRLQRYDDEKLREQIRLTEKELEVKTRKRDVVVIQYREKKSACMESKKNLDVARSEEKSVRDLVRTKRKEIDRAQTLMNCAKNTMTFEDATSRIFKMEHWIQHETLPLNEEKQLIHEIKQLKQILEQHSSDRSKMTEDQQALDQKEQIEEQLKVLRKEMDTLRVKLSRAEEVAKAAKKKYDDETASVNELNSKLTAANDVRQAAYLDLINLKYQWNRKNSYFHSYMDDVKVAYAVATDKEALEYHCFNQVEKFMELWNNDDEFRRSYVRCNVRSILRRFRTSDGRSLFPKKEPPSLGIISDDRLNASTKVESVASTSNLEQNLALEFKAVNDESAQVVTEKKNHTSTTRTTKKCIPPKKGLAEASRRNEVDDENKKEAQEEGDLAKKAQEEEKAVKKVEEESRRREKEAARLKEQKRLEENVKAEEAKERNKRKAEEAKERNKRKAEKAHARAEFKARKEAEEKEKEREKKARKKEKKMALLAETIAESTETEHASHSKPPPLETIIKEPETKEASGVVPKRPRNPSQYGKHNKIRSRVPSPPAPLRRRNRRWMVKQLIRILVIAAIFLCLFIIGNNPNSWLYRFLSFGSGH